MRRNVDYLGGQYSLFPWPYGARLLGVMARLLGGTYVRGYVC